MRYRRLTIEGASYFFTLVTHQRRQLFGNPGVVRMLDDAIESIRNRHPFEIEAQVVLPDHLHAIWKLPHQDANYATRWRLIKEAFTRAYVAKIGAPDRTDVDRARGERNVWQRRFWEHLIRDDRDFAAHLDYIHLNPVHHGLTSSPRDWPHSTFRKWIERGVYEPTWGSDERPELPDWAKRHE